MAIVDGGDARDDTAFVIENGFDHMGLDPHHGHVGGDRAADVMKPPVGCANGRFQSILEPSEAGNRRFARSGEYEV